MPIDATTQSKEELLSKLYTIRAGLSVIAGETEKIREGSKKLEKAKSDFDTELVKNRMSVTTVSKRILNASVKLKRFKKR